MYVGKFWLRTATGTAKIDGSHLEFDYDSKKKKTGRRYSRDGSGKGELSASSFSGDVSVTIG